jgi:DHA1 family inner membrane transport protein
MDVVARPANSISVSPAAVLFMCVFTSQAAILVLAPILVEIAKDLDVSTAVAGQLRIFGAPVAVVVALLLARHGGRIGLRRLLLASSAAVAGGSLLSALAPSFFVLACAQVPLWVGVAGLVAAGIGAAGAWSEPEERSRVVARALAGAPAAWVVGMPVIGVVADTSWRLAFLAVPLPAAVITGVLLFVSGSERPGDQRKTSLALLLRQPGARSWALAELLAMSAWAGTLVFSGALFVETYGTSTETTGLFLALIAVAYLVGNTTAGRIRGSCSLRRALARTNLVAAAAIAVVWTVTPHAIATLLLFSVASSVFAARTVAGTSYGFVVAGEQKLEVGAARALFTHAGYLVGSLLGGAAYAVGGRPVVAAGFAALMLVSAAPYVPMWAARCKRLRPVYSAA